MSTKQITLNELPDVMDVEQLCSFLQVGKRTGYQLLKDNKIKSLKIGREYRIPKINILIYLGIEPPSYRTQYVKGTSSGSEGGL